jgi:hypothetical protein
VIPSAQPFSFPTAAPQATIYQTNGVLFYLGATTSVNKTKTDQSLGSSYILFGRNYNHQIKFPSTIDLKSVASREFVSEISNESNGGRGGGIRNDITTRSTTVVGDINGDGFLDLLVGYPMVSRCSVYLGNGVDDFTTIIATTGESFAIIGGGDPEKGEGGSLGWSSIRIGDLNGDGCDEMMVSAISSNVIYVIYGKREFSSAKNLNITELAVEGGLMKIIGNPLEINFGVSLTLLHQFRKGSNADLAITAQQLTAGQNTIYILFGSAVFKDFKKSIEIAEIMNNPFYCLRIIAPVFSYAGFSVAGIGDINNDGYDDLAIGSLPYTRGEFSTQKTYLIYGRKEVVTNRNELYLSSMSREDGFIIEGGGFLVTGIGDINADGVADMMITRYKDWKGQGAAYLISTPANITYSPSLQPSSFPTITSTSLSPSRNASDNTTAVPSFPPSFRPTRNPTYRNKTTVSPARSFLTVGTARPSAGKPSLSPSLTPTTGYHRLRGFSSFSPTIMPTINTSVYTVIDCSGKDDDNQERPSSEYHGKNGTHNLFRITANSGIIKLTGNSEGGAKNNYVLQFCPSDRVNVVISNFRLSTDIISVFHLSVGSGYSYPSLSSIAYSNRKGSLTLLFCSENRLQVILSSHITFELQEPNFLFTQINGIGADSKEVKNKADRVQIGIVVGIFVVLILVFSALSYQNRLEEKEKLKHEEWLHCTNVALHDDDEEEHLVEFPIEPDVYSEEGSSSSFSSASNDQKESIRDCFDSAHADEHISSFDETRLSRVSFVHKNDAISEPVDQNALLVPLQESLKDMKSSSSGYSSSQSSSRGSSCVSLSGGNMQINGSSDPPMLVPTSTATAEPDIKGGTCYSVNVQRSSVFVFDGQYGCNDKSEHISIVLKGETVSYENEKEVSSSCYSSSHSSSQTSSSCSSFRLFKEQEEETNVIVVSHDQQVHTDQNLNDQVDDPISTNSADLEDMFECEEEVLNENTKVLTMSINNVGTMDRTINTGGTEPMDDDLESLNSNNSVFEKDEDC